jgi:hypothetical protein
MTPWDIDSHLADSLSNKKLFKIAKGGIINEFPEIVHLKGPLIISLLIILPVE